MCSSDLDFVAWTADRDGHTRGVTAKWREVTGLQLEEVADKAWTVYANSDGGRYIDWYLSRCAGETDFPKFHEVRATTPTGSKWYRVRVIDYGEFLLGRADEITAEKELEDFFRGVS